MRWFLLLCIALLTSLCFAIQTPVTRAWGISYDLGQSLPDNVQTFAVDPQGHVYVVSTNNFDSFAKTLSVVEFDPYGKVMWSAEDYYPGLIQINAIALDLPGNVYLTGIFKDGAGNFQIATMKLYSGGPFAWATYSTNKGPGAQGAGTAIQVDSSGSVDVIGNETVSGNDEIARIVYDGATGKVKSHTDDAFMSYPGPMFNVNGYAILSGATPTGTAWEIMNPSGKVTKKGVGNTTASRSYNYRTAVDVPGNFYLASVTHNVLANTDSFVLHIYDQAGNALYTLPSQPGLVSQITATDPDHIYLWSSLPGTGAVEMFNHSGLMWSVPSSNLEFAADGTSGVVESDEFGGLTKLDTTGAVQWTQQYTNPSGSSFVPTIGVLDGKVYLAGFTTNTNTAEDALFLKYVEGIGLKSVGISPNPTTNAGKVTVSVTLNAPAPVGGFSVHMLSNFPSIISVLPTLIIPEGATYSKFELSTSIVDHDTSVTMTAQANGVSKWASTLVQSAAPSKIQLPATTFKGGTSVTATLTLTGPTGMAGKSFSLVATDPHVLLPPNVTVPAGQNSVTFTVNSTAVTANTSAHIVASADAKSTDVSLTLTP